MEQAIIDRVIDYSRFTFVLLILSAYLYAGMLIQLYIRQTTEHTSFIVYLLVLCLLGACFFAMKINRLSHKNDVM
ncbi:YrhC family protein [Paraliobacillus salinarum]|uniref:YrhC family protein n=1 Tax=Paraliobacillus salinarum TaxID=1158996 RepID=UPI0015F60A3D|nr:YrhC family protein [Paraliobacillus salinarum]